MKFINYKSCLLLCAVLCMACGKNDEETELVCALSSATIIHTIASDTGTLRFDGREYYVAANNSVDSRLYICNLPDTLRQNNLPIRYSGNVYETAVRQNSPCCAYGMQVSSIARR